MITTKPWNEYTYVAFDIEASNPYPLAGEMCEIAAVKWHNGAIVGEFQTLLKVSAPMSDFIISIHNITNEMLATAPKLEEKIHEFRDFIDGAVGIAHHAPFDMGFITAAIDEFGLPWPNTYVLCSSLLSRSIFPESTDHRLQTLVNHLKIQGGQAHRALDDAKACLQVFVKCMEKLHQIPPTRTLEQVGGVQGKLLTWQRFSIKEFCKEKIGEAIVEALRKKVHLEIIYQGGSHKGKPRQVKPMGLVRNPDGDFILAQDFEGGEPKRFYLNRITSASVIY